MRAVALYVTLGALVVSALGTPPPASASASASARGIGTASAEALGTEVAARRAAVSGIGFGPCAAVEKLSASVRCGTVRVPLDYARPGGSWIRLTVSRVRALGAPSARQGALVFNPGGPGASSLYFPMAARLPAWRRIAGAYDLVGYAPRGVGRSAPLSCRDPADAPQGPAQAPAEPSGTYKKERIAEARAYARGCARRAGPALRHYNSLNNARDLEVLRAALGERRLTYMGASYGTYFGALYATLFPGRVRRMVFDSAVDPSPGRIWYANNLGQSLAFERRWRDFRVWAARHDAVYHLGTTEQAVRRGYDTAAARLARRPAGGTVGPGRLQAAFLQAGYNDALWPKRALALSEYLKGDPRPLIEQASPRGGAEAAAAAENARAVYTAVECNDAPWPADWRVWDRDNTRLAKVAPFETWPNVWLNLPCAFWAVPRRRPLDVGTEPGALPPTLILAAERDAATPYEGALELRRRLAGSVLVTERDAGTHGVAGGPNACVNGHLEAYLLRGRTPVRRASCAPHPEPDPVSLERRTTDGPGVPPGPASDV
ncbi:alpha/beta hydrolase [Streptomyces sp. SP18CS02]|uniref:alpha/beta hydrolase n=1 Tax=Streptomyces sp. SP18CS02 TaxID=3002531 RepID=UPI002E7A1C70|nr:alpha/beta hydrolase [Streptomyces sp. SP18CS02]MEE1756530.1 alpha/beta hydrolase [Streptomyces sp. SP18CS02]